MSTPFGVVQWQDLGTVRKHAQHLARETGRHVGIFAALDPIDGSQTGWHTMAAVCPYPEDMPDEGWELAQTIAPPRVTHYLPALVVARKRQQQAVCGAWLTLRRVEHSTEPTCPDCAAWLTDTRTAEQVFGEESAHTPGPWYVRVGNPNGVAVHWCEDGQICPMRWTDGMRPDVEARVIADARLIAAAPDLLLWLTRAEAILRGAQMRAHADRLLAGIKKATGAA